MNIPTHAQICSSQCANFHFMHNSQSAPNRPRPPRPPHPPSPPAWGSLWSKFGLSRSLDTLIFIWRLWTHWWRAVAAMLTFILWALFPRNSASIWWTSLTGVSYNRADRLHLTSPIPWVPPPVWVWRLWKLLTVLPVTGMFRRNFFHKFEIRSNDGCLKPWSNSPDLHLLLH